MQNIGIIGADGFVGECVVDLLCQTEASVFCFTRRKIDKKQNVEGRLTWVQLGSVTSSTGQVLPSISTWLCLAPLWTLPPYFVWLKSLGAQRVIALSSTSRFSKADSIDDSERRIAARLANAEDELIQWAISHVVDWILLRPTLIYGLARDKNLSNIIRFTRRFRFFPVLGEAQGLRQPIHVRDLASVCVRALLTTNIKNRAYNISGGEIITYREMVVRIFAAQKITPRFLPVPQYLFSLIVKLARFYPPYQHFSPAMANRMNADLVFGHMDAVRDFGFSPRGFQIGDEDIG